MFFFFNVVTRKLQVTHVLAFVAHFLFLVDSAGLQHKGGKNRSQKFTRNYNYEYILKHLYSKKLEVNLEKKMSFCKIPI